MVQLRFALLRICIIYFYEVSGKEIEKKLFDLNTLSYEQIQDFLGSDDKSVSDAIKSIGNYLGKYKFKDWDKRLYQTQPKDSVAGFFSRFPVPPLKTLHWEVFENCDDSFIRCIFYLQTVIDTALDFKVKIKLKTQTSNNKTLIGNDSKNSINNVLNDRFTPFYSPIEKFEWKTTASYFMCWYTMLGIPALSMLSEPCVNFDSISQDPRSNNKMSFACALFSFCPDPCSPRKYIMSYDECNEDENNPCFLENIYNHLSTKCKMKRDDNQNFNGMIGNKWNVSCSCKEDDFLWSSKYGMCVDINECTDETNNCDNFLENCLNTPGSYYCVYKSGFIFNYTFKSI